MTRNRLAEQAVVERNRRARDDFLSGQQLSPFVIDPAVVRAWQRCVRLGLQAEKPIAFEPVHRNAARAVIESNRDLLSAATAELDLLGRALVPSGASVVLADASMMTIAIRGMVSSMPAPLRAISREGVDLSEPVIGSNALTIAAIEQTPSVVIRNAHFCLINSVFSCAAAPIRSPNGNLLGVLDVTTCQQALPLEAAVVVNTSARAIENGIFRQDPNHLVVRFHPRADLVGTPLQAIVRCSVAGEIVGANEVALALLGLRWPLRGVRFARCFRSGIADLLAQAGHRETFQVGLLSRSGMPVHAVVAMPAAVRYGRAGATPVDLDAMLVDDRVNGQTAARQGVRQAGTAQLAAGLPDAGMPAGPQVGRRAAGAPVSDRDPAVGREAGDGLRVDAGPGGMPAPGQPDQAGRADPLAGRLQQVLAGYASGIPLLVHGESGTGKATCARLLHDQGPASRGPFEVLVCNGLDGAALDAGLAAGAGGTCVLQEVSDLTEPMQARLLRLLQQRQPGRAREAGVPADALLVSTSHRDLLKLCEAGRFRYDLYFRLKGQLLSLPPLRSREDRDRQIVRMLRSAFLLRHGTLAPEPVLEPRVMACLADYRWPGNFRELDWVARMLANAVEPGQLVGPELLPFEIASSPATGRPDGVRGPAGAGAGGDDLADAGAEPPVGALRDVRDRAITQAIAKHQGNLSRAARELGVSRGTLYRRLKALEGKESDLPQSAAIR